MMFRSNNKEIPLGSHHRLSKRHVVATGAASLLPGIDINVLSSCEEKVVFKLAEVAQSPNLCIIVDKTGRKNGVWSSDKKYHLIGEKTTDGKFVMKYQILRFFFDPIKFPTWKCEILDSSMNGEVVSSCSAFKCPLRRVAYVPCNEDGFRAGILEAASEYTLAKALEKSIRRASRHLVKGDPKSDAFQRVIDRETGTIRLAVESLVECLCGKSTKKNDEGKKGLTANGIIEAADRIRRVHLRPGILERARAFVSKADPKAGLTTQNVIAEATKFIGAVISEARKETALGES